MIIWLLFFSILYVGLLIFAAKKARSQNKGSTDEILLARSGVPTILLFLSFAATLFSTFTLMGVPDFFRNHGVATWIFIGVTDVAMGFVVLWFGLRYKTIIDSENIRSMSGLLKKRYLGNSGWIIYLLGIFVFLAPYVAIQIQGVSQLLTALTPGGIPAWSWAVVMLALIFIYSWVGGLRAIMYSDVAQGVVLLGVLWAIATILMAKFGGPAELFEQARNTSTDHMTAPGPKGLMSFQFLFASFIAILWMPVTQPQLTTRIAAAKSVREIPLMALGISFFALLVLLPTIIVGMVGLVSYTGVSGGEFLAQVLVADQPPVLGALAIVGLIAAAMSTADSQLFALGSESQVGFASNDENLKIGSTKIIIVIFTIGCFALSLLATPEIVSLARVSFAGTGIIGPMIILAIFSKNHLSFVLPLITAISLFAFLLSSIGVIGNSYIGIRLDLLLFAITSVAAISEYAYNRVT